LPGKICLVRIHTTLIRTNSIENAPVCWSATRGMDLDEVGTSVTLTWLVVANDVAAMGLGVFNIKRAMSG
jgi:hypothetical protein